MDLISAAKNGNFESVFSLLQNGCSTELQDKDRATPLYWSACHGHTNICEILIQAGSDVNSRVTWGSTPLHAAADRGHKLAIEVLLESGADVNATNNRGDTALHIAAYRGHKDVIMTLLRAKADVSIRNEKGKTPQQEAMEGGHRGIAEDIVEYANVQRISGGRRAMTPDGLVANFPPEIHVSSAARRKSECAISYKSQVTQAIEDPEDPDYENAERRTSIPGPLPNFKQTSLDVPPPRPPIARSTSFSGNREALLSGSSESKVSQMAARTNSVGSIPYDSSRTFLNDVRQSDKSVSKEFSTQTYSHSHQESSLSQSSSDFTDTSAYSSDTSWRTSSMTSAHEPTESSDYSVINSPSSRSGPELPPRARTPQRPNRLSIGSMRDLYDGSPDAELKKQLVESYRQTEKLAKENEVLNFKCSTLLSRLSDTEQLCNERLKECDSLKELVDAKILDIKEKECVIQALKARTINVCNDMSKNGFKHFSERLNKTLSEEVADELHEILRDSLLNFALSTEPLNEQFDAPYREWVPGVDYVIIGRQHVEEMMESQQNGTPKYLSFLIKHLKTGRRLILKMLLRFRKRGDTHTDTWHVISDEVDIMERLGDQPNVVKILHSYESSTERFKKFISVPHTQPHNPEELCNRTTFIVTEQMMTLTKFIKSCSVEQNSAIMSTFLLHCFYQLLSLLCFLDELGIEHKNINEGTIFVNEELRPMLGGFEQAVFCSERKDSQSEGPPDYENVEHLARGTQMHRLPRNFAQRNNDLFALGKFFDNILLDDGTQPSEEVMWPPCSSGSMTSLPPSVWQVLNGIITKFQNYSSRDCLHRIGFSLFGPRKGEVSNLYQTKTFMQHRMFKLLASNSARKVFVEPGERVFVANVINRNKYEIEAHFLCNITAKQLWEMYKMLEKDDLLLERQQSV